MQRQGVSSITCGSRRAKIGAGSAAPEHLETSLGSVSSLLGNIKATQSAPAWPAGGTVVKCASLPWAPLCPLLLLAPLPAGPHPLPTARSSLGSSLLPAESAPRKGWAQRLSPRPQAPVCLCSHYRERKCLQVRGQVLTAEAEDLAQSSRRQGAQGLANAALEEGGHPPTHLSLSLLVGPWASPSSSGSQSPPLAEQGAWQQHTCPSDPDQPMGRWAGGLLTSPELSPGCVWRGGIPPLASFFHPKQQCAYWWDSLLQPPEGPTVGSPGAPETRYSCHFMAPRGAFGGHVSDFIVHELGLLPCPSGGP